MMAGPNPKRTLYVGGLDENVTEELIRAAFIPFGDILTVNIPTDGHSGRTRGFAFIEYEEPEDAASAQDNMHNAEFYGKVITCTIAKAQATKGRPIWEDEGYMHSLQNGADKPAAESQAEKKQSKVMESQVIQNAPKRLRTAAPSPIPSGFVRCKGCGGWGVDLVKPSGYCNHCERTGNLK